MHRRLLLVASCLAFVTPPTLAADTALQCAKLFDSRSGKLLGAHTIVVRDGKVATVLPGRAEPTAGATARLAPAPAALGGRGHLGVRIIGRCYVFRSCLR